MDLIVRGVNAPFTDGQIRALLRHPARHLPQARHPGFEPSTFPLPSAGPRLPLRARARICQRAGRVSAV